MLSPVNFIREVVRETRKVTWPTRKQTQNMTVLVIGVSIAVGAYIAVLDLMFQKLLAIIL